jgi:hypothetical protein
MSWINDSAKAAWACAEPATSEKVAAVGWSGSFLCHSQSLSVLFRNQDQSNLHGPIPNGYPNLPAGQSFSAITSDLLFERGSTVTHLNAGNQGFEVRKA